MARIRPLARAPIIEALVDFRVQVPDRISLDTLNKALDARSFGYERKSPILRGTFGVTVNMAQAPTEPQMLSNTQIVGARLESSDGRYVAQFTLDGFTLSRLSPYESWELLIAEAKRVWAVYRQCVEPLRIFRTATRFINNLQLPLPIGERFERYLTGLPSMPADYPQTVSSFFQRFVVFDAKCGATAILTQALEQITEGRPLPVILDIDVFRETNFSVDGEDAWSYLAQLRALKNTCFFGAITEEAAELYQ